MTISLKNGVYYIVGKIDEYFEYDDLLKAADPLKINLGSMSSINSMGVRKFLSFTLAWSPKKFEFFECTPEFIAYVNVIPQMLGTSGDEKQIISFYVPFSCEKCQKVQNILFQRHDIKIDADGEVEMPERRCLKCKNVLELDVDVNEYFMFLEDA